MLMKETESIGTGMKATAVSGGADNAELLTD